MITKICKKCGEKFETSNSRKQYCNQIKKKKCKVCGKEFEVSCQKEEPEVCSKRCAGSIASQQLKTCEKCGKLFKPNSARQKYCHSLIESKCKICGNTFYIQCGESEPNQTCENVVCKNRYAHLKSIEAYKSEKRICKWCGKEFTPVNNTQIYCTRTHYRKCETCGKEFKIDLTKQDKPKNCSIECARKASFKDGNPFSNPASRERMRTTMLERYGVEYPAQSIDIQEKIRKTYKANTGYEYPMHNPTVRKNLAKSCKDSKFELRVADLLAQYNIEFMRHYILNSENASHEFDFYIPKYKILIDCDGVYFHSYLDDPDGGKVLDYYDEDRLSLIPKDHIFHVIVEGQEEKDIKYIVDIIKSIDSNIFNYESDLFTWCRSIEFPYPQYTDKRMKKDIDSLCKYSSAVYKPSCRLGDSLIQNFHKSIYDANVRGYVSPKEAWYDDKLLKKVILNRLIYKNDVDPFKVLKGFNISKICPRVSIFNPILAKYLIQKYLNEFEEIFDPFSGFSGRMLGAYSANKRYIGQDLNSIAVAESNQIVNFLHNPENILVTCKNIFESSEEYECLLTCPPYFDKEIYSEETVIKSCDDWIDEILYRFKCNRYVFVVDKVSKYRENICESIKSTSHLNKVLEYIVVIDR